MGKSQKKRQMRRHNPMRVPDSHLPHGLASASATSSKNEAILPIMQKMESVDPAERKWACVAVSNLIQNDPSTRRLLQGKNVVAALITRLSDNEEEVIVEAAGSLRNLCIDGGYDICGEMFNKNILSPLKTFVPKISSTLSQYLENPKSAPENAQKIVYEFADNVITILWCLSETSNKALSAINQMSLVPFLMSFLASKESLPISTVTSAAQCLYVLTDDNPPASDELRANAAYTACLLSIARGDTNERAKAISDERYTALRVLCSGILRHVSPIPPPSIAATVDLDRDVIIPVLEPVLRTVSLPEISSRVQELASQEESMPSVEKLSLKGTPKSDHKTPAEMELQRLEEKLRTVQLALEILTGVCASLPDAEMEEGGNESVDEEEDQEMDQGDDLEMAADAQEDVAKPVTSTALPALVAAVLPLIQPTPLSFPPLGGGTSLHPPTTSALSALHICAMECLNNSIWSVAAPISQSQGTLSPQEREKGLQVWDAVWNALSTVTTDIGTPGQERRRELWHIGVGVLWGIGLLLKGYLVPNEQQVQVLIQLYESTSDSAVKVKCIGILECLAHHPQSVDANQVISKYLLSLLPASAPSTSAPVEPLLQAVSALIDIYSDETLPYDVNFRQGNYVDLLAANVEPLRKVVRSIDRKRERDLKLRGEEIRDNLVAFVQYRRGLRL
ncbi:ARM repeat-containing protein [Panus rudis PR-1116 ss-1]|nr:ARM repeat-containing protein [Panus rudis PR-1116 ss-1]